MTLSTHSQLDLSRALAVPAVLFLVLALLTSPRQALGHAGHINQPVIELELRISEDHVTVSAYMPLSMFIMEAVGDISYDEFKAMTDKTLAKPAQDYFAEHHPLLINGVAVRPTLVKKRVELFFEPTPEEPALAPESGQIDVTMRYETKGLPGRVSLQWSKYLPRVATPVSPIKPGDPTTEDVIMLIVVEGKSTLTALSLQEQEYTWHNTAAPKPPQTLLVEPKPVPATANLPMASIAVLLVAVGIAWFGKPIKPGPRWGLAVALLITAVPLAGVAAVTVNLPWDKVVTRPSDDEAKAVFRSLHTNVYRAFDYLNESDIYDTLAQSVDGPQLEKIYTDIYQSLILRDEGGAVCKVQGVDIDEMKLVEAKQDNSAPVDSDTKIDESKQGDGDMGYAVRCKWRVHGMVRHWGHTHERTNAFDATFRLAPRGGQWKIINSQVHEQQRVVEPAPKPLSEVNTNSGTGNAGGTNGEGKGKASPPPPSESQPLAPPPGPSELDDGK